MTAERTDGRGGGKTLGGGEWKNDVYTAFRLLLHKTHQTPIALTEGAPKNCPSWDTLGTDTAGLREARPVGEGVSETPV